MTNIRSRFLQRILPACRKIVPAAGVTMVALSSAVFAAPPEDQGDMKGMDHGNMPGMKQSPGKSPEQGKSMAPAKTPEGHQDAMKGMDPGDQRSMDHGSMKDMKAGGMEGMQKSGDKGSMESMDAMEMGPMQGGQPPADARDPNAYADGLKHGPMPGMDMADNAPFGYVLLDKFEYVRKRSFRLDAQAWYGGDRDKLWLKADGTRTAGRLGATRTEALWDRTFATFWSSQLGLRHDFGGGPGRNWVAAGVQGLSPYRFDVQATAYAGPSGRTAARLELDYDLFLTQRWILQPNVEVNVYGKNDPRRGIGSGLSDIDAGLRLRYDITRQFGPYIGVAWSRKFGNTASFSRASGEAIRSARFVAGVRVWF